MDFSNIKQWQIPEGNVVKVEVGGSVLWQAETTPEDTVQVSGTWYLSDYIVTDTFKDAWNVKFTSNGTSFSSIQIRGGIYYDSTKIAENNGGSPKWVNEAYRTITFDGVQTVSAEFYAWLTQNATQQIYTVSVFNNQKSTDDISVYDGDATSTKYIGRVQSDSEMTFKISSGYITLSGTAGYTDSTWYGGITLLSNDSDTATYSVSGDGSIEAEFSCFAEGTQITLADGNTKAVEEITYDNDLLVWDFYNGEYTTAKPFWIMRPAVATYYYKITLSNGNEIKLIGSGGNCHRVFSVTKNKFEYATKCVGDDIYTENGIFRLVSCERVNETVRYYNLKTEKYHNCFANGILTCGRFGNMYNISDMKYCSNIPNFTEEEIAERETRWEAMRLPR